MTVVRIATFSVSVLIFLLFPSPLVDAACMMIAYAAVTGPATVSRKKVAR